MYVKLTIFVLVLLAVQQRAVASDSVDVENSQERTLLQKRRLSLQNAVDIQQCLLSSGDVGCATFECFNNNSCEIRGLHQICLSFLQNAGKFDSQGKSFIKDALKCMAHGLRHKFSCVSRKCVSMKDMVFQLQRECYIKHNLCLATKENVNVIVEMIHFHDLFFKGPYVELVNILLGCSEEVHVAIAHRIFTQCEKNWGAICSSLSLCPPVHAELKSVPTHAPVPALSSANFLPSAGPPLPEPAGQEV